MGQSESFPLQLTNQVWLLGTYHFNLYLLKGSRQSALVELGVSAISSLIIQQLDQLKIKPDYLVLTHPHTDHLTGVGQLQHQFPDAQLMVGNGAMEFLAHPKAEAFIVAEDQHIGESLVRIGVKPVSPSIKGLPHIVNPLVIKEETRIDLGGLQLEIVPVSGHAPGQLMVNVPALRTLFPSDALGFYFPGRCILPLFFTSYNDYCTTIQHIRNLKPLIIGIPHQGPIKEQAAARFLENAWRATLEIYNRIKKDPRKDQVLSQELFAENYRDEFLIYGEDNIKTCMELLVKRVRNDG